MNKLTTTYSICLWSLVVYAVAESDVVSDVETSQLSKRSYNPWMASARFNSIYGYNAASVFKPATYTITRPYYIPVQGSPGGIVMYYPPQPIYRNPGTPIHNPAKPPYKAPGYLPPVNNNNNSNKAPNRFGGDDDDDDDAPIWGTIPSVQIPLSSDNHRQVRPTRPPIPKISTDRPSLVHGDSARPPAAIQSQSSPSTSAPPGPSNCVWAIISCCSATNPNSLSDNCFEQRGCPGPFWGGSPCRSDYARAAIAAALDYYGRNPGR